MKKLLRYDSEEEWFEFKENWFDAHGIGEYISALSYAAVMCGLEYAYLVWGVEDKTKKIVGTNINYQQDYKGEPYQHYLARLISPSVFFSFNEVYIDEKRVVILEIPAAKSAPTSFDGVRYIRIGSSKENVSRYPTREVALFSALNLGIPSLINQESEYQELTFRRLFTYYAGRGIELKEQTFKKNLHLLLKNGKYNMLAQILSDDCHMSIRVSIFTGKTKATPLFSIKEFGNTSILIALEKILEYGDVLNLILVDEQNRTVERKETSLFDKDAFREAVINAFVHNKWTDGNAPMFTVYSDRIEILSRGKLSSLQTREGFFRGESIPVNPELSDIFLQLHISERSGRGVPKITEVYGRESIEFRDNSIVVNIPLSRITIKSKSMEETEMSTDFRSINETERKILMEIRNNPNISLSEISNRLNLSYMTVQKYSAKLREDGLLERVGSKSRGYWKVTK